MKITIVCNVWGRDDNKDLMDIEIQDGIILYGVPHFDKDGNVISYE